MFKRIFGLSVMAALFLGSCNSKGCYETTEVKVYCSFYSLDSLRDVEIDSVTVWGVGSDSIICNNETVGELALELNPSAQETQYVVQAKAGGYTFTDTISLRHTNQPWFQNVECGCMVFSKLDTCLTTGSIFQSATILNPEIINKKTKHVVLNL
ncbi:MAG: DUF6452 family protein [Bacteroidales bacterium]|nr:DUF6452 family protein [Bacteroidales bacterium]